jgi:hypothetical protein
LTAIIAKVVKKMTCVGRALTTGLVAYAGLACIASAHAEKDIYDGKVHFLIAPYFWVPKIDSTVTFERNIGGIESIEGEIKPSDYLDNLDFAGFISGEIRKGRWSIYTDYMSFRFSGDNPIARSVTFPGGIIQVPVNLEGSFDLGVQVWTFAGGYTAWHDERGSLDVLLGSRLLDVEADMDFAFTVPISPTPFAGSASGDRAKWDTIAGVRGQLRLGKSRWAIPYHADAGGGSDNWTYNALIGVGYEFRWGQIVLAYRRMGYEFKGRTDLTVHGPGLGAVFRF